MPVEDSPTFAPTPDDVDRTSHPPTWHSGIHSRFSHFNRFVTIHRSFSSRDPPIQGRFVRDFPGQIFLGGRQWNRAGGDTLDVGQKVDIRHLLSRPLV